MKVNLSDSVSGYWLARHLRRGLAAWLACCSLTAMAQWIWVDAQGRKVFSDQPPPLSVPEGQILKRPVLSGSPVNSSPRAEPTPPVSPPAKPKPAETELDRKAREAKAKEAESLRAQQAQQAQEVNANCERARRTLLTIQSGARMSTVDDKGERIIVDDQARAAEQQRTQDFINSNCNR